MQHSEEQEKLVRQLKCIFVQMPLEHIAEVLVRCNWQVNACIDELMAENVMIGEERSERTAQTSDNNYNNNNNNKKNNAMLLGAISKSTNNNNSNGNGNNNTAQKLTHFNKLNDNNNSKAINANKNNNNNNSSGSVSGSFSTNEQRIVDNIAAGLKIMIIMRGVPGSGKSYLANTLLERAGLLSSTGGEYTKADFIMSTDDFFYDAQGRYRYTPDRLDNAHAWNHQRVEQKVKAAWSPIIVDNTNLQCWEMLMYVKLAVKHGYMLELLEPKTPWRNSPTKLAMKNCHRVPRDKIQHMLDKYESTTVKQLMQLCGGITYERAMPQKRALPAIPQPRLKAESVPDVAMDASLQIYRSGSFDNANANWAKVLQQQNAQQAAVVAKKNNAAAEEPPPALLPIPPNDWTQFDLWPSTNNDSSRSLNSDVFPPLSNKLSKPSSTSSLLDLLKQDKQPTSAAVDAQLQSSPCNLQRHKVNCINESKSFVTLRKIYPNKQLNALWDLFVKCNGDIDWVVDLLLRENEGELHIPNMEQVDISVMACNCDKVLNGTTALTASNVGKVVKPQRQTRVRTPRGNKPMNTQLQVVKETIENRFVLGEAHYSQQVRKLRDERNGSFTNVNADAQTQTQLQAQPPPPADVDSDEAVEPIDLVELKLDASLLQQLSGIFKQETQLTVGSELPAMPNNVFVPRVLARELYLLWVETVLNVVEEQRAKTVQEDEEFARLLANPKYQNFPESPSNVRELLDMEDAWHKYKTNREILQNICKPHINIAMHLTKLKLCEDFPHIPEETLLDIMAANENSYAATVQVLRADVPKSTRLELLQRAKREQDRLQKTTADNFTAVGGNDNFHAKTSEELRQVALRSFEENRNLASHHCQLKGECYNKAREAIQLSNSAVAEYYSEIASLHRRQVEMYNNRAANSIVAVHKYSKDYNDEVLDLHYLFVIEAVACLDVFLDRHIAGLRTRKQTYKQVFIITGRGLHSLGGVSTVKNRVRGRLKERCLRWVEVNPGLLKVKLFPASYLTEDF